MAEPQAPDRSSPVRPLSPPDGLAPTGDAAAPDPSPRAQPDGDEDGGRGIVDCALYEDGYRRGGVMPLATALEEAQAASRRSGERARRGDADSGEAHASFVWIGLHEPAATQFEAVAEEFGLHPLAVEDAVHAHQRPKLETYGDTVFVVLKTVRYVDPTEVVEIGEVMLFLGADFVVTVRHGAASALREVRRNLEARPDLLRAGPSAVLYAVADHIVDGYKVAEDGVANDVEEIEAQVFSGDRDNHAERIYKLKREIVALRRAIAPLADPLERLARGRVASLDPRTAPYFRDVQDHLLRTSERVEGFSELLNSVLEANVAGVTMRQNEDMRKITAWVAILAWITMIAGIYGMNFDFMPELHWVLGYPFALSIMAAGSILLYRAFRKNRWL